MVVATHRNAKLIIDRNALYKNILSEKQHLNKDDALFMVVKANGYGHGAIEVAKTAVKAGANGFCVAMLDEALELRHAGFKQPILILGISRVEDVQLIAKENISVTVSSLEWLKDAQNLLRSTDNTLKVHLGLDTGMGRIGFQNPDDLKAAIDYINNCKNLFFEGVFTHFATADEKDKTYFNFQLKKFKEFMTVVKVKPRYVHVSNSATSLWHSECNGNMVRYGVAGYGLNPSGGAVKLPYELYPALSLTSEIVNCKLVKSGNSIGYGATYTTNDNEWIGTVPVGYADGVIRKMQGFNLLVNGYKCPIVGRVCMDQLMIKLPTQMKTGTKVTIVGKSGDHKTTLQDIATYCDTIHYEVACLFTNRLKRVYIN
ncbi:alanine racemase [Apilactobacillus apisilvae]|uniref:Alanine racemase n=1 Tax=Apilactobacillus apisilvae TaxID=2923364 RepID=A0ABY4PHL4_9LACO|nr:alanine racemase [Apilactobacillus apisilvae]UQS85003.1 alanine racemase [Apilactobacillus apisilvae]